MRKILATLLFLALSAPFLHAQNVSDLIISEVLAQPDSTGILDDYGRRCGWVELYNKSTGTVNYGGCYLTDDRNNLRKSLIPKTDLRTKLGARQVVLFYCSGNGGDGTYYAGFTLEPGKTVYLVSNDGRTVIDSLAIPSTFAAGQSVAKLPRDIRMQDWQFDGKPSVPSPGILNGNQDTASKGEFMKERDPHGWILSITSVSVVFVALAILWFLFWLLFDRPAKKAQKPRKAKPAAEGSPEAEVAAAIALALEMEASGDEYAAIATAVYLYMNDTVHDVEPGIITIHRSETGWNNKSLNFRKLPH